MLDDFNPKDGLSASIFHNRNFSEEINNFFYQAINSDTQEPLTDEDILRKILNENDSEKEKVL